MRILAGIQTHDAKRVFGADQIAGLAGLQSESNLRHFGRHLVTGYELVIAHHYAPIVLGNFFVQRKS
jgi:hypothetical protein